MPMTFAQAYSRSQLLVQDTDTTDPGLSTTQWSELLNGAMDLYYSLYPEKLQTGSGFGTLYSFSAGEIFDSVALTDRVRDIVRVETNSIDGAGVVRTLNRVDLPTMRYLQTIKAETGPPRYWAAQSPSGSTWDVYLYPIPAATTVVSVVVSILPTEGSFTGVKDGDDRCISDMAAIDGAMLLRRPMEMIQNLVTRLAAHERVSELYRERVYRPKAYAGKDSV